MQLCALTQLCALIDHRCELRAFDPAANQSRLRKARLDPLRLSSAVRAHARSGPLLASTPCTWPIELRAGSARHSPAAADSLPAMRRLHHFSIASTTSRSRDTAKSCAQRIPRQEARLAPDGRRIPHRRESSGSDELSRVRYRHRVVRVPTSATKVPRSTYRQQFAVQPPSGGVTRTDRVAASLRGDADNFTRSMFPTNRKPRIRIPDYTNPSLHALPTGNTPAVMIARVTLFCLPMLLAENSVASHFL
jgi:hypothetical protein